MLHNVKEVFWKTFVFRGVKIGLVEEEDIHCHRILTSVPDVNNIFDMSATLSFQLIFNFRLI